MNKKNQLATLVALGTLGAPMLVQAQGAYDYESFNYPGSTSDFVRDINARGDAVGNGTLPYIYAEMMRRAEIEIACGPDYGVNERRRKDEGELTLIRESQRTTEQVMEFACRMVATATVWNPMYYLIAVPRAFLLGTTSTEWVGYLVSCVGSVLLFILCLLVFHLTETRVTERI